MAVIGAPVRGFALWGVLALAGCYRYTPVAPAGVSAGRELRVELADRGTAELAQFIGPRSAFVQGLVQSASDSIVQLAVRDVTRRNGSTEPWNGEVIPVQRSWADGWSARRFDRRRTFLAAAGAIAAMVAVDVALGSDGFIPGIGGGSRSGAGR